MITTKLDIKNLQIELPKFYYGTDCWMAGGAIRDSLLGVIPSDIDIFGTSKEQLDDFIKNNLTSAKKIYEDNYVKSFIFGEWKVQVIYRFFKNIDETLDSFDFTICQFAYNGESILCNPESLIHLFSKKLVVHKLNPKFCVDSLRRMQKYIKKGYSICGGGINDFVNTIRAADKEEIKQQLDYYPDGKVRIARFD